LFVTIDARRCAEFPDDSLRFYMFREIPSRFSKFVVTLHDNTFTRSAHTTWNRMMNLLTLYCNLTLMTLMASVYKTTSITGFTYLTLKLNCYFTQQCYIYSHCSNKIWKLTAKIMIFLQCLYT